MKSKIKQIEGRNKKQKKEIIIGFFFFQMRSFTYEDKMIQKWSLNVWRRRRFPVSLDFKTFHFFFLHVRVCVLFPELFFTSYQQQKQNTTQEDDSNSGRGGGGVCATSISNSFLLGRHSPLVTRTFFLF